MKAGDAAKIIRNKRVKDKIDLLLVQCDDFHNLQINNINLGLLYIAAQLESKNYKVKILTTKDVYDRSNSQLRWFVKKMNPRAVGFYTISDNYEYVLERAQKIKKWVPDTWVILGGPLASSERESLLVHPFIDAVSVGEGEYATEDICFALKNKLENLKKVEGLIYKNKGEIEYGPPPTPIEDLDSLPFPDSKYFSNQRFFQIVSGRGCPYKCTFCFQSMHGLKYRFRSSKSVLDEVIRNLETNLFVGFDFIDDVFIMDPKRCMEIAKGLQEYREISKRDFIFMCQGRANVLEKHPEMIKSLSKAGMVKMQLGIESGDPKVLEYYNKKITLKQVRKSIQDIKDTESSMAIGGFILGGPFENEKSFRNTVDFAVELIEMAPGAFMASAGFLGAYPGTKIAKNPKDFGLAMVEKDFAKGVSLCDVQFVTEIFNTKDSIRNLQRIFEAETFKAMQRNLSRIPKKLLQLHYIWASKYGSFSHWYSYFLQNLQAPKQYFTFIESPRFRKIIDIPLKDLLSWYPLRVIENRNYDPRGNIILPLSIVNLTLEDPMEILIYELSAGKLNINEIAQYLKKEKSLETNENELINNLIIPFLKKLEDSYHIVFYQ